MDTQGKDFSPPYNVAWATFINAVEKIASDLPNKVDRSYLGSMSGGQKSYLISAFKGFGLIKDDLTVTAELRALATKPDERPQMVADLLREYYPLAVKLGTSNSTTGELDSAFAEMFPSVTGESRTKAIRFFLSAVEFAGVEKSPLWKAPKPSGSSGSRRGRPKRDKDTGVSGGPPTPAAVQGGLREFVLPSGHKLTISIDCDLLTLVRSERKFVNDLIDEIEDHIENNASAQGPDSSGIPETTDGDENADEIEWPSEV